MLIPRPFLSAILVGAALAGAGPAFPAATGPEGIDLLSASGTAIRFGVSAPSPELVPSPAAAPFATLELKGWAIDGPPGEPRLPVQVVRVAVPPTGPVSVHAFGSLSETREAVDLEAGPGTMPPEAGAGASANFRTRGSLAPERAKLLGVSWLRNQRIATVAILPVDYDPADRRLTSFGRVEVEVTVRGTGVSTTPWETQDPFESVYASVLVNYEQGRSWRRSAADTPERSQARGPGLNAPSPVLDSTSIFAGHQWVKIAVATSGFYRVTYGQLRTLIPFSGADSIPFAKLRIYAWPGRPVLSETDWCDGCAYRQVALGIEDFGADSKLSNNQDAFYFYAQGSSDWADHYDPSFADSVYIQNPYDSHSYYFLSFDRPAQGDVPFTDAPARITSSYNVTARDDGTENHPATFTSRLRFETDSANEYFPSLYRTYAPPVDGTEPWAWDKFLWRSLTTGGSFTQSVRTPGADPTVPAKVRVRSWGTGRLENCSVFYPPHILDAVFSSPVGYDSSRAFWFDLQSTTARLFPLLDTLNTFRIRVPSLIDCPSRYDQSTLSWFDVTYARRFTPDAGQLWFDSPGNGNAIYRVGPFQNLTMPRMFDISDAFAPREMVTDSAQVLALTGFLPIEVNESGPSRYAILPSTGFIKPAATDLVEASAFSGENLRAKDRVADQIIIYYDGFKEAADSLARWRQTRMPLEAHAAPYHVTSLPVSSVYDQFSGGRTDPAAIRNFLRTTFYNWRAGGHAAPAFVTLFGDASFDFRDLLGLAGPGQPGCLLPSFEDNIVGQVQYATDDWLLNVDDSPNGAVPDFYGGRIPAGDAVTAMDYVKRKLFAYERSAPTGAYRNRVMLIADDDQQGERPDALFWRHLQQTAVLDSVYTPPHVDRAYVYLHTYPDGPGRTKPLAKADIKNIINGDGVALFNYIGHGSPFKLSDENVLIDVDAGTFTNSQRLPLFVAASCDVGKFNDPRVQSLGERLLLAPSGGTVGVVSATELAYSDFNVKLNNDFYTELFLRQAGTGQFRGGVVPALLAAKIRNSTDYFAIQNNQKYQLIGDAALRLNLPTLWVELSLYDAAGTSAVTEIRGGETITCAGRVLDRPGGTAVPYSGIVDLLIEDSQPRQTAPDCAYLPGCSRPTYDFRAGAIFRGDVVVTGGSFSGKFIVPLEARSGPRGKVRAYVQGLPGRVTQTDGVGSIRVQVSPGSAGGGDNEGPIISLSFPGGATSVKPDATLRVELSDPSGILTTGHTTQNGIVVTVDGNTTARTDITSTFRYAAGSYTHGTATFPLPNLAAGKHTIAVSAADNLAGGLTALLHRSNASIAFEVANAPPVTITNAYLFPNPTESGRGTSGGQFVVDGPGDAVNVLLRIYTISGRMIRELKNLGSVGQVQISWDGRDAEGFPLANGTYLFKVYVNGRDEKGRSTARQQASTEGRFVILNH